MTDNDKLLWLFEQVHGEITGNCYTEIENDTEGNPIAVHVMKDGNSCWSANVINLLFDYTKDLEGL